MGRKRLKTLKEAQSKGTQAANWQILVIRHFLGMRGCEINRFVSKRHTTRTQLYFRILGEKACMWVRNRLTSHV
jgi:hypothetical protein